MLLTVAVHALCRRLRLGDNCLRWLLLHPSKPDWVSWVIRNGHPHLLQGAVPLHPSLRRNLLRVQRWLSDVVPTVSKVRLCFVHWSQQQCPQRPNPPCGGYLQSIKHCVWRETRVCKRPGNKCLLLLLLLWVYPRRPAWSLWQHMRIASSLARSHTA